MRLERFLLEKSRKFIFQNFYFTYLHKSYWYGRINLNNYHNLSREAEGLVQ